jgi:hypothetical protein
MTIKKFVKILTLLSFFIYVPYGFSGKESEDPSRPAIVPPEVVVAPTGGGHCMGVSKKKVAIFKAAKLACSKNVAFIGEGRSCFMMVTGRDTPIKREVVGQYCDVSYFDTLDELLRDPQVNRNSLDNVKRMKILEMRNLR